MTRVQGDRGPGAAIKRVVEWPDTDAAGHYHHSTVLRWVEAAEAELYAQHDLLGLFGVVPRVHLEVNHRARLWFMEEVEIVLDVERLGRSSITFAFTVHREGELAVDGSMTAVHIDQAAGKSVPWPDEVRAVLKPPLCDEKLTGVAKTIYAEDRNF